MDKVVIWGASGHSKVVTDIIELRNEYDISGYIDNISTDAKGKAFLKSKILGGEEVLDSLLNEGIKLLFLAFGDCQARTKISDKILSIGFELINAVHPESIIASDVMLGYGNAIMAGAIVNPGSVIGNNIILNTNCCVDHDCYIDDGCHICPGVTVGGHTIIEKNTWVGIGTIVKDHIKIGKNCIIGAGTNVLSNIPENCLVYGNPGKVIRKI